MRAGGRATETANTDERCFVLFCLFIYFFFSVLYSLSEEYVNHHKSREERV